MAFNRIIEATIGTITGLNLKISDLNMSFEIERSNNVESNSANFTIYNAKKETRQQIEYAENNIIFKAGHVDEGNLGIIFTGIIIESSSRKENTEWITDIQATDFSSNTKNLLKETISLSYTKNIPLSVVINDIRGFLNIPLSGIENVTTTLGHNFVYVGDIRGVIKKLEDILSVVNLGLYFDNSEMVIYILGQQDSKFGVIKITPKNGLLGEVEEIKDNNKEDNKKRYSIPSLLNPKIKPNILIQLESSKVKGLFITEKVKFTGDNFGGDFVCNMEVVE